jgi:type I restriction enzyme M protein
MDYWAETMQDDVYMIVSDGWREAAKPRLIVEDKDKKTKEKPDFTVSKLKYKAELIPTALVVARYFAAEQAAIEKLEAEVASIEQAMEEIAEEHSGEAGARGVGGRSPVPHSCNSFGIGLGNFSQCPRQGGNGGRRPVG